MRLIVTEKPSVAQAIAAALDIQDKKAGYRACPCIEVRPCKQGYYSASPPLACFFKNAFAPLLCTAW